MSMLEFLLMLEGNMSLGLELPFLLRVVLFVMSLNGILDLMIRRGWLESMNQGLGPFLDDYSSAFHALTKMEHFLSFLI
jgi:hypothetical protein